MSQRKKIIFTSFAELRDLKITIPEEPRGPKVYRIKHNPQASQPLTQTDVNGVVHNVYTGHADHTFVHKGGNVPRKPGSQFGSFPKWTPTKSTFRRAWESK